MKGVPRNDIFFNYTRETIIKLKKLYGFDDNSKIVIYAQTFRRNGNVDVYQLNAQKMLQSLRKKTGDNYTCEELLNKLKSMNFADIESQGFMPLYTRDTLTDKLHDACGFRTDYQFITKSSMKTIQKKSKCRE